MAELAAKLRIVPVDRHHVRRLAFVAADRDELRLGEIRRDLLHRRDETPGVAHDDLIALVGVIAQSFGFVGVGNVFRIGRLEAMRLEALQDRIAERVPALIVGASGQQDRGLVFRMSGRRAPAMTTANDTPAQGRRSGAAGVNSSWNEPLMSLGRPALMKTGDLARYPHAIAAPFLAAQTRTIAAIGACAASASAHRRDPPFHRRTRRRRALYGGFTDFFGVP